MPSLTVGRAGCGFSTCRDRVLLVATYWRTNLTVRQIGPLFGVSHSTAHRVIDTLGPLLAPVPRRPVNHIAIVDGTLIPSGTTAWPRRARTTATRPTRRSPSTPSTRLVIAVGDPQPGNRNDTIVYRTSGIDQKPAQFGFDFNHGHQLQSDQSAR